MERGVIVVIFIVPTDEIDREHYVYLIYRQRYINLRPLRTSIDELLVITHTATYTIFVVSGPRNQNH